MFQLAKQQKFDQLVAQIQREGLISLFEQSNKQLDINDQEAKCQEQI